MIQVGKSLKIQVGLLRFLPGDQQTTHGVPRDESEIKCFQDFLGTQHIDMAFIEAAER